MNFKHWIQAFRLKTLPLALATVILGNFLAKVSGSFSWIILALTFSTTIFLQILSNLANDYGDAINGVDNEYRVGPARAVQSGLISGNLMKRGIILFIVLSLISGFALLYFSFNGSFSITFFIFLIVGIFAIYAAIKYTMGKNPYGYSGLGDLFVLVFFGWIAVLGTFFLQTNTISFDLLLPASSIGFLSVGVLNLNNMRDAAEDRKTGKNTIASKLGEKMSKNYHAILLCSSISFSMLYMFKYYSDPKQWLYLIFMIPIVFHGKRVLENRIPAHLDPELKKLALATLLFSISYGVALLYPSLF